MSHAEQIIAFVLLDMTTLTQEYSMLLERQVRSNPATHRGVCGVSILYIYICSPPPPMIHPNDGPSLLQSVWAQVQTIFYVKQTELVQKNK